VSVILSVLGSRKGIGSNTIRSGILTVYSKYQLEKEFMNEGT